MLADVHLQMRELHVALGAAGVQAHKRLAALVTPLCDLLKWHGDHLRDKRLGGKAHWHLAGVVHRRKTGEHPLLLVVSRGKG